MIDGTPVLDIKPWVSHFDLPPDRETSSGWFDEITFNFITPAELSDTDQQQEDT